MSVSIKKFLKNEYIYAIGTKMMTIVISFLQSILLARYLGASIQGSNSYISSIVSIGSIVVTWGMHQAYPFFRRRDGKDSIYTDFVSVIMALYAIYMIIAVALAVFVIDSFAIRAATVLIPLYGYSRVVGYITLIESPNVRNRWWTIISVLDVVIVIIFYMSIERSKLVGVVLLSMAELFKAIVYTIQLHVVPRYRRSQLGLVKEMAMMGFFPMLALLMTTLNYKIDILMLRSFDFITDAQIGIYSIGMLFADKVVLIPDTLKGVLASKLAKGADENEVARVCRICFWASGAICIGLLLLGEPVIQLLYGDEYNGAYSVLVICSVGSIFVGYFKLIAQYNIVNKKQIRNVVLLAGSVLINYFLNLILIPKFLLNGAATASGVGYFATGIIFVIWFARSHGIKISEMFLLQREDIKYLKNNIKKK